LDATLVTCRRLQLLDAEPDAATDPARYYVYSARDHPQVDRTRRDRRILTRASAERGADSRHVDALCFGRIGRWTAAVRYRSPRPGSGVEKAAVAGT